MKYLKIIKNPISSVVINSVWAFSNCFIGYYLHSWWFVSIGLYYLVLSIMRFSVLRIKRLSNGNLQAEFVAKRLTGILFLFLAVCLVGIVILSAVEIRGTKFHEIIMISIALYAFTKITLAIINLFKSRKHISTVTKTLFSISFADALVSVFSLQRSMLVTFEGFSKNEILLFNTLTGSAVCLLVLLMGINLIEGRYVKMAKSKIVKANEKIADAVVSGYKKVENAVVGGYTKIEDKFVDAYLTKDGESVEEAKKRLKNQK